MLISSATVAQRLKLPDGGFSTPRSFHFHSFGRSERRRLRAALVLILIGLLCQGILPAPFPNLAVQARSSSAASGLTTTGTSQAAQTYGRLPLSFEINQGQTDSRVKFLSRGHGYSLFLTASEAALRLRIADCGLRIDKAHTPTAPELGNPQSAIRNPQSPLFRLKLVGANPAPQVTGLDELPGRSNYFIGNDPDKWRTNVPQYARVKYRDVYPGIDLIYYGQQRQLEYDLVVAPGADPRAIQLAFDGAEQMRIDQSGDLVLTVAGGELRQHQPVIYQMVNGARREIPGQYKLIASTSSIRNPQSAIRNQTVGFEISDYDASLPLVIDPILSYATYLGSNGDDWTFDLAADFAGNTYITGTTSSLNFPAPGTSSNSFNGGSHDAFVAKLNPGGSAVIYSTFIGGNGSEEGHAIAVDRSGNAYLTGFTNSINFPTTAGVLGNNYGGGPFDGFATKLNSSGAVVYSTFLGGNDIDRGNGIAVDFAGNAYITGETASPNFTTTPGSFRVAKSDGSEAFLTKLNSAGTAAVYSTFLENGAGNDVAIDLAGNAYVTGQGTTLMTTTAGAAQTFFGGGAFDAFVMKLNPAGSARLFSTFIGDTGDDRAFGIAVDFSGQAYVTGYTSSTNFPTANAIQATFGGGVNDAFVTKLNAAGSAMVYSTYLGDLGDDRGASIAVDFAGNALVAGDTSSINFPKVNPVQLGKSIGLDAFVTKINSAGTALVLSTFFGGNGDDTGSGIAVDGLTNAYVAGTTFSLNLNTTPTAFQLGKGGGQTDGFVIRIGADRNNVAVTSVSAANFKLPPLAAGSIAAAFGTSLATSTQVASSLPLPLVLGGTAVLIRDSNGVERAAPLFFVSAGQVNFQVPPETATGPATVVVVNANGVVSTGTMTVVPVAPGLFSITGTGQGPAAGFALRVRGSTQTLEPIAQFNAQGQAVTIPINLDPSADSVFLVIFGTGIRNRSSLSAVTAAIGGMPLPVDFAGAAPGFVGLDQVNIFLPQSLKGKGEVDLTLTVDGQTTNAVRVNFK
jgi:uncharacterized protein (TIGR03437 family)